MRTQNLNTRIPLSDRGFLTLHSAHLQQTFELQDITIIGREPTAQVTLTDSYASHRHARILRREDGFYLQDQRSRNGTFVNGCRVVEAKLQDHDRIVIGLSEFTFACEKMDDTQGLLTTSKNEKWNTQLQRLPHMAQSPHPVLILGPSGAGKEVIASLIHRFSARSQNSFLSVNCSALSENLAESELFGHMKGSFTGAQSDRKGAFEAARGGTLFLDEIGDMPLSLQPKILRALENKEIKPVGSDEIREIDVRIVAATNKNLKELVKQGKFREDLYFRLHILQIQIPALRERMEDFDQLLQHFARPQQVYFTIEGLVKMRHHTWPGNIRELKNAVTRAAALFSKKPITEDLVDEMIEAPIQPEFQAFQPTPFQARKHLRDYEREAIIDRLILFEGNQRQAAKDLGIAKSTFHDRLRRYGINVRELLVNHIKEKAKEN